MKTEKHMIRLMGKFDVIQRTTDGMFNATSLLDQWNQSTGMKKNVNDFMRLNSTHEFINQLKKELNFIENPQLFDNQVIGISQKPDSQVVSIPDILYVKKGRTNSVGKRTPTEIWMHPYLYIDFSMWLNPAFKVKVIKFVYDQLISYRHSAGDHYKALGKAIARFEGMTPKEYSKVGEVVNYCIWNKNEPNLRQRATQDELKRLSEFENHLAVSITMGTIKSYKALIKYMTKYYKTKWM